MIVLAAACIINLFGLIAFDCWQNQNPSELLTQLERFRCQEAQPAPVEWLTVSPHLAELHAAFVDGPGSDPMGRPVGCPLRTNTPYGPELWAITASYGIYGLALVDPWDTPRFYDRAAQQCWMISEPGQPLWPC